MNNTQRANTYIVLGMENTLAAIYFAQEHPRRLEKAAQNAGITDEISTIADVVIGSSAAGDTWKDGILLKAHVYLLLKG